MGKPTYSIMFLNAWFHQSEEELIRKPNTYLAMKLLAVDHVCVP